tara:strand:+ start:239 stop:1090 length:852 start_codon:yes stop_codon:yes gene_type:complete
MDTSREDVGIAIRSAFLKKGAQQRFSLFFLTIISIILLYAGTIKAKPVDYLRSFIKDIIYRGSVIISSPSKGLQVTLNSIQEHFNLYENYNLLKIENTELKNKDFDPDFLIFENQQLRKILDDQIKSEYNLISSRVMLDKQSPYLNSFVINGGSNRGIKKGFAVLDGKNFIGRIVDVNFFSSRVLLISDLNSKIPVIIEPDGFQAILSGSGSKNPILEFLPENHKVQEGNKVYTSGKEGIFTAGIPIGKITKSEGTLSVSLNSDLSQIMYVNIYLKDFEDRKN